MEKSYRTIEVTLCDRVARIVLNRPTIHNAFDDVLISEMRDAVARVRESDMRVLVIAANGKSFCAGADMNWMKRMNELSYEENFADSYRLSQMFQEIYSLAIPTIARVQGAAVGGGVGLISVCDVVVASTNAIFSLSEVKIGLVPACVFSYLLQRVHQGTARYYFLTGRRFRAREAKRIGLVNKVYPPEKLDEEVASLCSNIIECGPQALKTVKELLDKVPGMPVDEYMEYTAKIIAELRVSKEGQEGFNAFLEKRKPVWGNDVQKTTDCE